MENFITADTLKSLPGQVMAVLIIVQMAKSMFEFPNWSIRLIAMVAGVAVNVGLHTSAGLGLQQWVLVVLNGVLVAAAAMKTAEATQSVARGEVSMPALRVKPTQPSGLVASRMSPNNPDHPAGDK